MKKQGKNTGIHHWPRLLLASVLSCALVLAGCASEAKTQSSSLATPTSTVDEEVVVENTADYTIQSDASVMDSYDWSFTDRDVDCSYEEVETTKITLSDTTAGVEGTGAMAEGSTVTVSEDGVYVISGSLTDGSIVVDLPEDEDKVQLVLKGADITCSNGAAILVENADKVFITCADGTENTVSDGSTHDVAADESDHDGAIFSHDDLTLNGTGTLTVNGNYNNGIVGKDDVCITGGTYILNALGHGIQGKDCIKILDGTFTVESGADAFHASNDEDSTLGYMGIGGGTFTVSAGDDAFHAESALLVAAGDITITTCYEGFEGKTVSITGGVSSLTSTDDAVNAASGDGLTDERGFMDPEANGMNSDDCFLEITGGTLYIHSSDDGLDSNGTLTISGGNILIESVTAADNSALDCEAGAVITGGTAVAVGPNLMAQGFGTGSTQASIMLIAQSTSGSGGTLSLTDSTGTEVYSCELSLYGQVIVVSTPDMIEGETYTVHIDGETIGTATAAMEHAGTMGQIQGGPQGDPQGSPQGDPRNMGL